MTRTRGRIRAPCGTLAQCVTVTRAAAMRSHCAASYHNVVAYRASSNFQAASAMMTVAGNPDPTPSGAMATRNTIAPSRPRLAARPLSDTHTAMAAWLAAIAVTNRGMWRANGPRMKSRYHDDQASGAYSRYTSGAVSAVRKFTSAAQAKRATN